MRDSIRVHYQLNKCTGFVLQIAFVKGMSLTCHGLQRQSGFEKAFSILTRDASLD